MILEIRMDCQAAYFSQALGINLKRTTSDELAGCTGNEERIYTREIPLHQLARKEPDQRADFR
jgi:hypothetical protein